MEIILDRRIEPFIKTSIYKKHGKECRIKSIYISSYGIDVEYQYDNDIYHTKELTIYWNEL